MKWLGMKKSLSNGQTNQADSTEDQMFVNPDVNKVLRPLDDRQINLVSIFGAARQGKSFLMNLLANQQVGVFSLFARRALFLMPFPSLSLHRIYLKSPICVNRAPRVLTYPVTLCP